MKYSYVGLLIAVFALGLAAPAAAAGNPIAGALGNLRWGMSEREVKTALEAKLKDKATLRELESSRVEFDGKATRWDSGPVAEEYTHGNEEAMLTYKDSDGSSNYYFFIGGQLWKWVKLYPAAAFGGHDFSRFASKLSKRFGKGHDKQGEVNPGSGSSYQFIEFLDRNTRLRAVDKTKQQDQYALVFEAMDTVRSLASLRSNTIRRAGIKRPSAVASAAPERSEPTRPSERSQRASRDTSVASNTGSASKKKSIFADEQRGAGEDDYNTRKQRVQADAHEKQRHMYERGQESKKGKVLDDLAGIDDDDPLVGAR
jgi:hypothetical protein